MAIVPPPPLVTITPLPGAEESRRAAVALKPQFAEQDIQPPAQFWVTPDDFLMVQVRNSLAGVTVAVQARMWTPEGELSSPQFTIKPPADRVSRSTSVQLYYGYLVSVVVFATGATLPQRGQTYVSIQVGRTPSLATTQALAMGAGYLAGSNFIQWPYSRVTDAVEGMGLLRGVVGTTPAAGAEVNEVVPTSARWRLRSFQCELITSAALGNRLPVLRLTVGVNPFQQYPMGTIAPSTTIFPLFIPEYPSTGFLFGQGNYIPMPNDVQLDTGFTITTLTTGLDAADQYSNVRYQVEEWMED